MTVDELDRIERMRDRELRRKRITGSRAPPLTKKGRGRRGRPRKSIDDRSDMPKIVSDIFGFTVQLEDGHGRGVKLISAPDLTVMPATNRTDLIAYHGPDYGRDKKQV